jgi:hypothetical protein
MIRNIGMNRIDEIEYEAHWLTAKEGSWYEVVTTCLLVSYLDIARSITIFKNVKCKDIFIFLNSNYDEK